MIGENELTLNHATIARAVEEYLGSVSAIGHKPKVLDVAQMYDGGNGDDSKTRRFAVKIKNDEVTP